VVELGPGGGPNGGEIIYQGPLAGLLKVKASPTCAVSAREVEDCECEAWPSPPVWWGPASLRPSSQM